MKFHSLSLLPYLICYMYLKFYFVQQVTGGPKFFDGGTKFITLVSEAVGDDSFTHIVEVEVRITFYISLSKQ